MKKLLLVLFMMATTLGVMAKDVSVSGTVVSKGDSEPLIGVSVIVKGTSKGVATDFDGKFTLDAPENSTIVFSYVGFNSQTITVKGNMSNLNVVMVEDAKTLDDLVVVGYGVQKKSVVTASIAKVSADDLQKVNPVRVDDALKGLAAGINVTSNSGQPGSGSTIRVRGIGTVNNTDPLYVVDGMPVDDIAFLNPSDIASIEVLKDAASGAVYGARAANGVILITTRGGNKERVNVSYDFSFGIQNPWRKRQVLNATEYAIMMNEGSLNNGGDIIYSDPYSYGEGTNWQDEVFTKNAKMQSHNLSISGGSEKVDYYLSASYTQQDGIIGGGDWDRSNYERITVRANNVFRLFDESKNRTWLTKMNITSNMTYIHEKTRGIDTNSEFGSVLGSAVTLSPILGVFYADEAAEQAALAEYAGNSNFTPVYSSKTGRLYTIPGKSYNEIANPVAYLELPNARNSYDKFYGNWGAELYLWKQLRFKSTFGLNQGWSDINGWTPLYYLNDSGKMSTNNSVYNTMTKSTTWQTENTLAWDEQFGDHSVSVLLGQSAMKSTGRSLYGSSMDMLVEDEDKANIDGTTGLQSDGRRNATGGAWEPYTLSSYFGRVSYNYAERYMFQATVRRDGSSRFGSNNRYATFPSFSLGWNLTNEPFMAKRPDWLSNTKVRFSWGKNGNDNIGNFGYLSLTATGNNYVFGSGAGQTATSGVKPAQLTNADLKWEESEQTDIGIDFGFFRNMFTFTADYFYKRTSGMLMDIPVPGYVGEVAPEGNVGTMENKGLEFELGYNWKVGDWDFHVGANASWVKTNLINLGNSSGYITLESVQGLGEVVRGTNGMVYPYFYGYTSNGIFQNMDEVKAYVNADGEMIQPDAQPGDVRWVDVNGDGQITSEDQGKIGKGVPDWTYGLNITVNWKDWDFTVVCQGVAGNDIYDATRRNDITSSNLPKWMLNRWTGEGTSDKYPRFSYNDQTNWAYSSDLYLFDGSYFRVKNIRLGYTLPSKITKKFFVQKLRFYVAAENLLTFTKYPGFDPEITNGSSLGVDRGIYPQSRTWTFGLNLNF